MRPSPLENGLIAVLDLHEQILGAGFLLRSQANQILAVTCAHVIEKVLPPASPHAWTRVRFQASGQLRQAQRLPGWIPSANDLAFLIIEPPLPEDASQLSLAASRDCSFHRFLTRGYPDIRYINDLIAEGTILGWISSYNSNQAIFPRLQLESSQLTKGFSGAPVWDTTTGSVVGMISEVIQAVGSSNNLSTGLALPAETLAAELPQLDLLPASRPGGYLRDRFLDRSAEQLEILNLLEQNEVAILTGLPGMGKTSLAAAVAAWYCANTAWHVLWVNFSDEQTQPHPIQGGGFWVASIPSKTPAGILATALRKVIKKLSRKLTLDTDEEAGNHWLVVLHEVLNPELLFIEDQAEAPFSAPARQITEYLRCHLLITSTRSAPSQQYLSIHLEKLPEDQAIALIFPRQVDLAAISLRDQEAALQVCRLLGGHPQALKAAGVYLSHNPTVSLAEFAAGLENNAARTDFKLQPDKALAYLWADLSMQQKHLLVAAAQLQYRTGLKKRSRLAKMARLSSEPDFPGEPAEIDEVLEELTERSLVRRLPDDLVELPALVMRFARLKELSLDEKLAIQAVLLQLAADDREAIDDRQEAVLLLIRLHCLDEPATARLQLAGLLTVLDQAGRLVDLGSPEDFKHLVESDLLPALHSPLPVWTERQKAHLWQVCAALQNKLNLPGCKDSYIQARNLLDSLPDQQPIDQLIRARLNLGLGNLASIAGRFDEAILLFEEASRAAQDHGKDKVLLAKIEKELCFNLAELRRMGEAEAAFERAMSKLSQEVQLATNELKASARRHKMIARQGQAYPQAQQEEQIARIQLANARRMLQALIPLSSPLPARQAPYEGSPWIVTLLDSGLPVEPLLAAAKTLEAATWIYWYSAEDDRQGPAALANYEKAYSLTLQAIAILESAVGDCHDLFLDHSNAADYLEQIGAFPGRNIRQPANPWLLHLEAARRIALRLELLEEVRTIQGRLKRGFPVLKVRQEVEK